MILRKYFWEILILISFLIGMTYGFFASDQRQKQIERSEATTGIVLSVKQTWSGRSYKRYYPTIEYKVNGILRISETSDYVSYSDSLVIGQHLNIYYDSQNVDEIYMKLDNDFFSITMLFLVVGLTITIVPIISLREKIKKNETNSTSSNRNNSKWRSSFDRQKSR